MNHYTFLIKVMQDGLDENNRHTKKAIRSIFVQMKSSTGKSKYCKTLYIWRNCIASAKLESMKQRKNSIKKCCNVTQNYTHMKNNCCLFVFLLFFFRWLKYSSHRDHFVCAVSIYVHTVCTQALNTLNH